MSSLRSSDVLIPGQLAFIAERLPNHGGTGEAERGQGACDEPCAPLRPGLRHGRIWLCPRKAFLLRPVGSGDVGHQVAHIAS